VKSSSDLDLSGRRIVITGAGRGFGAALARVCARLGARLMLSARGSSELERTRDAIVTEFPDAQVALSIGDVSSEIDVLRLAKETRAALGGTDVLVCNAGVYGPKGPIEAIDLAAWSEAISINLLGVVLCVRAFSADLKASDRGKVILLSGGGATKPMPNLSAYAASKAAVVRFGETLAHEWKTDGVDVNMIAPGALNTRMLDEVLEAGPEVVGAAFYEASLAQSKSGGTPLERGALLSAFLASRASDGISGRLISAVWDPWERLAEYRDTLESTDIYTLRRIVPADRGRTW
jgi:NAD(P)-dependent dehydrogenase (short-subunit alcohol dehydrogenase family)